MMMEGTWNWLQSVQLHVLVLGLFNLQVIRPENWSQISVQYFSGLIIANN
jgi:hypothetical protein